MDLAGAGDGLDMLAVGLQSAVVWCLAWLARKVSKRRPKLETLIRAWTPELSVVLAFGVAAGVRSLQAETVLDLETLKTALFVAGGSVLGHSVAREKIKALAASRARDPALAVQVQDNQDGEDQ